MRRPSGDQSGLSQWPPSVSSRWRLDPSESTAQTWGVPERSEMKATWREVGLQVGEVSIAGWLLKLVRFEPSVPAA